MSVPKLGQLAGYKPFTDWPITHGRWAIPSRENPRRVSIVTQLQSIQLNLVTRYTGTKK